MAGQILIPFNSHLGIKDIISVVEAAKPGMKVVFLIRYPVDRWAWFHDHWVTTQSARDAMRAGRTVMEKYSWEGQRGMAEEMVAPWRNALEKMGVSTAVEIYTGSLSSLVENYGGDEISFVMQAENKLPQWVFSTKRLLSLDYLVFVRCSFSESNHLLVKFRKSAQTAKDFRSAS